MNNIGELDIKEITNINNITTSDIVKMNKEQITFVQQQLIDLGANLGKTGPNKDGADGDWGRISMAAFSHYKQGKNLNEFVPPPPLKQTKTTALESSNALKDVLKEFVITALNSSPSRYKEGVDSGNILEEDFDFWSVIGEKFPDLQGFDPELLNAYASTIDKRSFDANPNQIPKIADINWEEINSMYANDFNFLEPSHALANKNGRGTDGIVQPVGYYQDKETEENDQYGDGLNDNFWYRGGGPDMILGPYMKSSDQGNTWTEMTVQEINLYEKNKKRNEINKYRNSTDLDSEQSLKNSTALENAYRFMPSKKQEDAVVAKNKNAIDDILSKIRKYNALVAKQGDYYNPELLIVEGSPNQTQNYIVKDQNGNIVHNLAWGVWGDDACEYSGGTVKKSGYLGWSCKQLRALVNDPKFKNERKLQLAIKSSWTYFKYIKARKLLFLRDKERGLISNFYDEFGNDSPYRHITAVLDPNFEGVPLYKVFDNTPSEGVGDEFVQNGDYYLNQSNGQKYQYIDGKHVVQQEFPFQWNTERNIRREMNQMFIDEAAAEITKENIESYIDKNQSWWQLSMPKTQAKLAKDAEKELKNITKEAKANIKLLNASIAFIEKNSVEIKNLTALYEKKSKEKATYFTIKSEQIEASFNELGEPVTYGPFKWGEFQYNQYNALVQQANDLKQEYNVAQAELEKDRLEIKTLHEQQKNNVIMYNGYLLKAESLVQDETELVEFYNHISKNGHALTFGAYKLLGSAIDIVGSIESLIAEVPMNIEKVIPGNWSDQYPVIVALTETFKGWGDSFEEWRGGMPVFKNGQFTGQYTSGYKGEWNKFSYELHNGVRTMPKWGQLESAEDYGRYTWGSVTQFLPQLGILYASGGTAGLTILSASAAGSSLDRSRHSNFLGTTDYSEAQRWMHASLMFGAEFVTERVTLGLLRGKLNPLNKRVHTGFVDSMKKTLQPKSLLLGGYYTLSESLSEGAATLFGQNAGDKFIYGMNEVSLFRDVPESMVQGVIMERTITMPGLLANNFIRPFVGRTYESQIDIFNNKLKNIENQLKFKNLSKSKKAELISKWMDLVLEKNDYIKNNNENVDMMSEKEVEELIEIDQKLHEQRKKEDDIREDKDLSREEKIEGIKDSRVEENKLKDRRNQIVEPYENVETREKKVKQYEENKKWLIEKIKKYNDRRDKKYGVGKGARLTFEELETYESVKDYFEDLFMEDAALIKEEILMFEELLKNPKTPRIQKNKIRKELEALRAEQRDNFKRMKQGPNSHGFIHRRRDGNTTIYINKQVSLLDKNGNVFVAAHEFLHFALQNTIKGDDSIRTKLGDALLEYTSTLKTDSTYKLRQKLSRYGTFDKDGKFRKDANFGEEVITLMSESILDGTLEYNEGFFTKIGDFIRQTLQRIGIKGIKFNTGKDVYNFIKDYNASMKKGYESSAINKVIDNGAKGILVEGAKDKGNDYFAFSKTSKKEIDDLANMGWDNKSWKEQGYKFAMGELQENRLLDGLIRAQYKVENVPPDFVSDVYAQLTRHVRNFNPEMNDSLFGWINSQLHNKAAEVYNKIYKQTAEGKFAKPIEDKTKEGETKVQVAAEKDVDMEAFETEDISPAARARKKAKTKAKKESKFRKVVGFETGSQIYNEILDAAKKSLIRAYAKTRNIKDVAARERAVLEELQKEHNNLNSPLFKQIKNWLSYGIPKEVVPKGTKDIYLENLKQFREDIVKLISTADFVQIERLIAEQDKIFTRFKGQLTRKGDVEKAVNEGRLPPDALRKYDKDKKVPEYDKVIPDQTQIIEYADQPGSIPSKKDPTKMVRSGLKGTRKDGLTKNIVNGLVLDAVMEARQSKEVQDMLAEMDVDATSVQQLSVTIGRPADVMFSRAYDSSKIIDLFEINRKYKSKLMGQNQINKSIDFLNYLINSTEPTGNYGSVVRIAEVLKSEIERGGTFSNIVDRTWNQIQLEGIANYQIESTLYDGALTPKHLDNLLGKAKRFSDAQIRNIAFPKIVEDLQQDYKNADKDAKDQVIIDWLKNNSKSSRTAKVVYNGVTITTNEQIYELIIKSLNNKKFSVDFVNKEKTKKAIFYLGNQLTTYKKIIEIKIDPSGSVEIMIEEARKTRDYIIKVIKSDKSIEDKKAIINLLSVDQVGAVRKLSKPAGHIINYKGKTTLEHRPPVNEIKQEINRTIENPSKENIKALEKMLDNSYVILLPTTLSKIIDKTNKTKGDLQTVMNLPQVQKEIQEKGYEFDNRTDIQFSKVEDNAKIIDEAILVSRLNNLTRGITVLDFDDTLATTKSMIRYTRPDGTKGKLNAEQYAATYEDLLGQGYEFDFSEFTKVVKGKTAPLFKKALKLQSKFGPENMFVLTARPAESAKAIYDFLKANGLNIPLKNITGLANSTAEAKALWIADKVAEGYNDFYFADDALQNVQAVKNMLDQFDVKSKVQQAKIQFSKAGNLNREFNKIIQQTTGTQAVIKFSDAQAKLRGNKSKYKSIIPASAQDFVGLLYNFLDKGKRGEKQMEFFKKTLIDPFSRGIDELNASRQIASENYKQLLKSYKNIKKDLPKKLKEFDGYENVEFTVDQAIRVYLWKKAGFEIPGLSKKDATLLNNFVKNDAELKQFADKVGRISKRKEGYAKPSEHWLVENINSDLLSDGAIGDVRSKFLNEFIQNKNEIFSKENLNKIQVIYGKNFREALEDMLFTMETGRNRKQGTNRLVNMYMNWVNNAVGAIMFFNMRSALLQTISLTNYINWSDNSILAAAKAFANQKQYWADFVMIFNSDYLKQRRSGNRRGINEAELSAAVAASQNKAKAAIAWLLQKGFLPTQIADSFAIASGGAAFYRNRVKSLMKEGMTQKEAEKQAFLDFQEITEVSQQSSRPDMLSQQQKSPLGRLVLAFANYPMQAGRIINKAIRDIVNKRGDTKTHISKIIYYGAIMNIIFHALQSAMLAMTDDEEEFDKRTDRALNSMIDTWLVTIGFGGRAVSAVKNAAIEYQKQDAKDTDEEFLTKSDHTYTILQLLSFSPPISSKVGKIYRSIQSRKYNREVFKKRGLTLDNPIWGAVGNVIEGFTNIPLGRLANKMLNIDNAMDSSNTYWQRAALLLGWNTWDLGIKDPDIEATRAEIKQEKTNQKKIKTQQEKDLNKINNEKKKEEAKQYKEKIKKDPNLVIEKSLFDLNKEQQVELLKKLGLKDDEIKKLNYESNRVEKISDLKSKKENKKIIEEYLNEYIIKTLEEQSKRKTSTRKSSKR